MRGAWVVYGAMCLLVPIASALTEAETLELLQTAVDGESPQPILDAVPAGLERDQLLAWYASIALDIEAFDLVESNRFHDLGVIYMAGMAYAQLDLAPVATYCDLLRGNYDEGDASDAPGQEEARNRRLCEATVSALNVLRGDEDACTANLHERLAASGVSDADELAYATELCTGMADDIRTGIEAAGPEPDAGDLLALLDGLDPGCDPSGVWSTNWGEMTLRASGGSLTGEYTWDRGRLAGSFIDGVFTGHWYEAPTYAGPWDAGDFVFTFTADCASFSGTWNYDNEPDGTWHGSWTGSTRARDLSYPAVELPDEPQGGASYFYEGEGGASTEEGSGDASTGDESGDGTPDGSVEGSAGDDATGDGANADDGSSPTIDDIAEQIHSDEGPSPNGAPVPWVFALLALAGAALRRR